MAVMAGCPAMGMRAALSGGIAELSVKNTFIDFPDEDPFLDEMLNHQLPLRQSSEPTPTFQRQQSATMAARPHFQRALVGVDEESYENEEPESEPTQPQFSQQDWSTVPARDEPAMQTQMYATPAMVPNGPWYGLGTSGYSPGIERQGPAAFTQPQADTHDDAEGFADWSDTTTMMARNLPNKYMQGMMLTEFSNSGHMAAAQPQAAVSMDDDIEIPAEWANTTTVMVRNLPNKYTQGMMLTEFNDSGFIGLYDFAYLPIDPDTNANRGYAFINFIDSRSAWKFKTAYEGRKMPHFNSNKHVSVTPATLQGFEANYEHYSSARVSRGDPAARPLFLREPLNLVPSRGGGGRSRRGKNSAVDRAAKERGEHGRTVGQVISQKAQIARAATMGAGQTGVTVNAMTVAESAAAAANNMSVKQFSQWRPPAAMAPRAGAEQAPVMNIMFCPFCGGQCSPGFRFCQFCGASLEAFAGLR